MHYTVHTSTGDVEHRAAKQHCTSQTGKQTKHMGQLPDEPTRTASRQEHLWLQLDVYSLAFNLRRKVQGARRKAALLCRNQKGRRRCHGKERPGPALLVSSLWQHPAGARLKIHLIFSHGVWGGGTLRQTQNGLAGAYFWGTGCPAPVF